jgi:YVTN family beta-propeller protein
MPSKQHSLALSLAVVALLSGSGCTTAATFQGKILSTLYFGFVARCIPDTFRSSPFENGSLRIYSVGADGSLTPAPDSPLNGEDCDPSEDDDARANTMSSPMTSSSTSGSNSVHRFASGVAAGPQFQDRYPLLSPLPFAPLFSPIVLASYTTQCTPNTGIYMVNHFSSTVTHYSTCPLGVMKRIQVGSNPLQLAVTPDAKTLIVTRYDSAVVFIDTATDTVTTTLQVGSAYPNGIALSPDGATAYVTSYIDVNPAILTIDVASRKVTGMTQVSTYPKSIFLTPDGLQAWVLFYQSSTVYVFDTLTMSVVGTLNAGGIADTTMAFSPNGTRAYVAAASNQLVVFDTATLTKMGSVTVGQLPSDVYVTPDGGHAYVNSQMDSFVSYVDLTTNTLIKNYPVTGPGMGFQIFH